MLKHLLQITHELKTQDNAATAYPLYQVQEKRWVLYVDSRVAESSVWVSDEGEVYLTQEEALEAIAEGECDDCECVGRIHYWDSIQTFLSRKAAEEFILNQKHNHGELRVFVKSAHNNPEMKLILKSFMKLPKLLQKVGLIPKPS